MFIMLVQYLMKNSLTMHSRPITLLEITEIGNLTVPFLPSSASLPPGRRLNTATRSGGRPVILI